MIYDWISLRKSSIIHVRKYEYTKIDTKFDRYIKYYILYSFDFICWLFVESNRFKRLYMHFRHDYYAISYSTISEYFRRLVISKQCAIDFECTMISFQFRSNWSGTYLLVPFVRKFARPSTARDTYQLKGRKNCSNDLYTSLRDVFTNNRKTVIRFVISASRV